jgi:hypothetical protein
VTSPAADATGAPDLPEYAPVPAIAKGAALNEHGYHVWHGPNHSPDNIYVHFPDHDTLMFIDVVNAGWIPIYNLKLHAGVSRDDGGGRVLGDGVEVGSDRGPYVLSVVLENRPRVDRGQRLA